MDAKIILLNLMQNKKITKDENVLNQNIISIYVKNILNIRNLSIEKTSKNFILWFIGILVNKVNGWIMKLHGNEFNDGC